MMISIIVAAYNVEKYISKTIDSVLKQTCAKWELIVINDGSTDRTRDIVTSYLTNDKIKLVNQENHGLSFSRNVGIKMAKGNYLWFVDGDDYIESDAIEVLIKKVQDFKLPDIIYFNYNEIINGIKVRRNVSFFKNIYLTYNPSACFKIYNHNLFLKNGYKFSDTMYEDLELSTIMLLDNHIVCEIDDYLYNYVIHDSSFLHSKEFNKKKDDIYNVMNRIIIYQNESNKYLIEFIYIYHLLYSFSLNLLQYDAGIYKKRIYKSILIIKNDFANWRMNPYYRQMHFKDKIIINLLWYKILFIPKFLVKLKHLLKKYRK